MKIEKQVNALWSELERTIDASSHDGDAGSVLHDYKSTSWHKNLEKLLAAAIASERGHRGLVGGRYPVSVPMGAKIVLLSNVADGTRLESAPLATLWMSIRRDAAEGMTLGWLLRRDLSPEWIEKATALDYAEIMNGKGVAA